MKAPLVKILDVIQLSDNNSIDEEDFINTIKIGAQELEEVIRKMSTELNKN